MKGSWNQLALAMIARGVCDSISNKIMNFVFDLSPRHDVRWKKKPRDSAKFPSPSSLLYSTLCYASASASASAGSLPRERWDTPSHAKFDRPSSSSPITATIPGSMYGFFPLSLTSYYTYLWLWVSVLAACARGHHDPKTKFGPCGIITSIVSHYHNLYWIKSHCCHSCIQICFPIGLICLL